MPGMIFKRNEQIPSFCIIHNIKMKPRVFKIPCLDREFHDFQCLKCGEVFKDGKRKNFTKRKI